MSRFKVGLAGLTCIAAAAVMLPQAQSKESEPREHSSRAPVMGAPLAHMPNLTQEQGNGTMMDSYDPPRPRHRPSRRSHRPHRTRIINPSADTPVAPYI